MDKLQTLSKIWQRGMVRVGIIVSAVLAVASAASAWIDGFSNAESAVSWAVWIYARANTPWLGVFVLVLVGVLLWLGIRRVERAELAGAAAVRDDYDKALRELRVWLRLPTLVAKIVTTSREIVRIDEALIGYTRSCAHFRARLGSFLIPTDRQLQRIATLETVPYATEDMRAALDSLRESLAGLGIQMIEPHLRHVPAVVSVREEGGRPLQIFHGQASGEYKEAERQNLEELDKVQTQIDELGRTRRQALENLEKELAEIPEARGSDCRDRA